MYKLINYERKQNSYRTILTFFWDLIYFTDFINKFFKILDPDPYQYDTDLPHCLGRLPQMCRATSSLDSLFLFLKINLSRRDNKSTLCHMINPLLIKKIVNITAAVGSGFTLDYHNKGLKMKLSHSFYQKKDLYFGLNIFRIEKENRKKYSINADAYKSKYLNCFVFNLSVFKNQIVW